MRFLAPLLALALSGAWSPWGSAVAVGQTREPVGMASTIPPTISLGVYIDGQQRDLRLLDRFEAASGRDVDIVHWFQPWGYAEGSYQPTLDADALRAVAARGATPMITWEAWGPIGGVDPSHVANIPTGAFDRYIDSWAEGLRAFGGPVYLRLFHEMNNPRYPWAYGQNGNTAEDLIAAWRHVHDRFARAGAGNVRWVWSPNTENALVRFAAIYPGDPYVDWFGVDGYNGGRQFDWGGWRSPREVFEASFEAFRVINPNTPIVIAETSSVEDGGDKAAWVRELYTALPADFPALRAIVWFHDDYRSKGEADWRLDTSGAALQAYRAAVGQPIYARSR